MPALTHPLPSDDKRWKIVNGTMRKNGFARSALIETLHTVQSSFYGFLNDDAIKFVAQSLRVPLSQAYKIWSRCYRWLQPEAAGRVRTPMTICTWDRVLPHRGH